jgi:hypothetical protein
MDIPSETHTHEHGLRHAEGHIDMCVFTHSCIRYQHSHIHMNVLACTLPPIRMAYPHSQSQIHVIRVHLVIPIITRDYLDQCIGCRCQVRLSRCQMLSQFIPPTQNNILLLFSTGLCILTDLSLFFGRIIFPSSLILPG